MLLVWLFATGAAFAHACTTQIDFDCDGCCVEMSAPSAFSSARADDVVPAQAAVPLPVVSEPVHVAWVPAPEPGLRAQHPPPRGGGRSIPIFFLRLAL